MSIIVLQSSWWGRESWLLCLICLPGVSWWLSSSSSRCHGVFCSLWLWYFLIILIYYFRDWHQKAHQKTPPHKQEYIEITRWAYFDIKLTRQGFKNNSWHREACRVIEDTRRAFFYIKVTRHRKAFRYKENTRWVSFYIKLIRQGFENACWHFKACRDIVNTRWVSFDIKFTRQGFENACWHGETCRDIENTRWVSFDIKFTRQGFENAYWRWEAFWDIKILG